MSEVVLNHYVVLLEQGVDVADFIPSVGLDDSDITNVFQSVNGFSAYLSNAELEVIAQDNRIVTVEPDQIAELNATTLLRHNLPGWGPERTFRANTTLLGYRDYARDGSGVYTYIMDSGMRTAHSEFSRTRVIAGYLSDGTDSSNHGTGVASTVAGWKYGVAPKATLIDVNFGLTTAGFTAGVDWILANHPAGVPAVVNMSFGWSAGSTTVDDGTNALLSAGIHVVNSAGNDNVSADNYSPARVPGVIVVANSDKNDAREPNSNTGTVIDLYAPGTVINAASATGDNDYHAATGTSFSAPITTGAIALMLQAEPNLTSTQIRDRLRSQALVGVVTGITATDDSNYLLQIPYTTGDVHSADSAAVTATIADVVTVQMNAVGSTSTVATVGRVGALVANAQSSLTAASNVETRATATLTGIAAQSVLSIIVHHSTALLSATSAFATVVTILEAPQEVSVVADIANSGWVTESGATTNLFLSLDEAAPASDSDFIKTTPAGPGTFVYEADFGTLEEPLTRDNHTIKYRLGKVGDGTASTTVELRQGATTIASWSHTGVDAMTTFSRVLTDAEATSITDYNNLRIRFEVTVV